MTCLEPTLTVRNTVLAKSIEQLNINISNTNNQPNAVDLFL